MIKDFIHYYKPYKKLFLLDFTCAVIVAILELAFPVMVRSVIDNIVPSQNLQQIILVGAGYLRCMPSRHFELYRGLHGAYFRD